ncbi:sensor histidine kinase [Mucilaginibacter lappiensis]|uniref:sensor histidine kinase n=1 Tax=Mucilaginibacter lappiensis TaxID=354630 RepID=UPI003D1FF3ED
MQENDSTPFIVAPKAHGAELNLKISALDGFTANKQTLCSEVERMQSAIKSLKLGTWTFDISTNLLLVCRRCRELLPTLGDGNVKSSELVALVDTEYSRQVLKNFYSAFKTNAPFDIEVPIVVPNEFNAKWVRITGVTTFSGPNSLPKLHGSIEDISDRKFSELLKQDYLAIVSHDLRSPLSIIKLYMQLFEREIINSGNHLIREMLKKSVLQVDKMNNMIECYLEASLNCKGEITLTQAKFDIKQLLVEIINDLRLVYPGYLIILNPAPGLMVFADKGKISQVIQNLLSNAIKYSSPKDVIAIDIRTNDNYVQVEIQDHGIGIKPADQKQIFNRFYRAKQVTNIPVKGYGIGLYLTKQIIKQHHGDIWLTSEFNKGSKFYFTLPYSCP